MLLCLQTWQTVSPNCVRQSTKAQHPRHRGTHRRERKQCNQIWAQDETRVSEAEAAAHKILPRHAEMISRGNNLQTNKKKNIFTCGAARCSRPRCLIFNLKTTTAIYLSNPPRRCVSHYLQIILPLICELLCGTRGLSRLAAAADSITGSGSLPPPLCWGPSHRWSSCLLNFFAVKWIL